MNTSVAIVYHYFAHYRLPIFKELVKDGNIDYTFVGDDISNLKIKLINFKEEDLNFIKCKNVWVFNFFLFQLLPFFKILKNDQIIILGNPKILSNYILVLLARLCGKKVIIWSHFIYSDKERMKNKIMVNYSRMGDALLSYNEYAADFLKKRLSDKLIVPVYNSLDSSEIDAVFKKKDFLKIIDNKTDETIDLIFIGRLTEEKKIELLLRAVQKIENCRVTIIGGGKRITKLKKLSSDLGISSKTKFIGKCYDESSIGELFLQSDICVSPGNVGLTAVHAFHYGIPVITHGNRVNQGPEYEIIDQSVTGATFKENDLDDLVLVIEDYHSYLRNNRLEICLKCREQIDKYYNPKSQRRRISNVIHTLENL